MGLFTKIIDQVPNIARVVMHGVGEPMLVKNLPDMIRYLKVRGTYVLFNTNGTLMQPKRFQELIDTGLDELASRSTRRTGNPTRRSAARISSTGSCAT